MFHLWLHATVLVLLSTFFRVVQATHYRTYYLDDSPEIHLGKEYRSVAKLIGFKKNSYSLNENLTFISKVFIKDSAGVVVTFVTQNFRKSLKVPSDEITIFSKDSNFTFNTELIDDERTHIVFGDSLSILYKCNSRIHTKVTFLLTAFSSGRCNSFHEFRCKNKLCIWKDLNCDKENNCGDDSDEDYLVAHCTGEMSFEFPGVVTIIIISLILLFLVSLITFFMINNWNKKRRNNAGTDSQPDKSDSAGQEENQNQLGSAAHHSDPLPSPSFDRLGGFDSGPTIPKEQDTTDKPASPDSISLVGSGYLKSLSESQESVNSAENKRRKSTS